jgi:hypothetical protein
VARNTARRALTSAQQLVGPRGAGVVGGADLADQAGAQRVQFAEHGIDLVHRGVRGPADLWLGLAVVAGHPLGERDVQDAGVLAEAAVRAAEHPQTRTVNRRPRRAAASSARSAGEYGTGARAPANGVARSPGSPCTGLASRYSADRHVPRVDGRTAAPRAARPRRTPRSRRSPAGTPGRAGSPAPGRTGTARRMSPAHALNGHDTTSPPAAAIRPDTVWQAGDPVLAALRAARDRRDQADRDIRILLAYARELATPGRTGSPTWPKPPADPYPVSGPPTPITTSALPGTSCRPSVPPPCTPETAAMTNPARPPERPSDVKNPLTPNRAGRLVENGEYAAFARRVLRAYARRIADGDVEALTLMLGLSAEMDDAIAQAVTGLRGFGYSWAEIGSRLGITRQAAQQRWGRAS